MGGGCRNQADAGRYVTALVSAASQRCFLYIQIEGGESASIVWHPHRISVRAQQVRLHRRETGLKARVFVRVRASQSGTTAAKCNGLAAKSKARGSYFGYRIMTVYMHLSTYGTACFMTYIRTYQVLRHNSVFTG